jgi:hypothetical protein
VATIYGRSAPDARRYLGSLGQVARLDSFIEADGPARGARRLRMITGGGLEVDIHPDRALDLGQVTVDGIPVAWMEATGLRGSAYFDPHSDLWLRTWGGGMLTTCGLDAYGSPSNDAGQDFGQHGRVSGLPSTLLATGIQGESVVVEGTVRQSSVGAENLVLHRRIESEVGSRTLRITDVVTNEGARDAIHMILYHANFGWPLVDAGAVLSIPSATVEAREDGVSPERIGSWPMIEPPRPDGQSEVYLHEFERGEIVAVGLANPRIGLSMRLEFDRRQLPWLTHWKMFTDRNYVLGLEPMNTRTVTSRADARSSGSLRTLVPGQSVTYELTFTFERSGPRPDEREGSHEAPGGLQVRP